MDTASQAAFFEYLLRIGDDRLVHAHRLSEWCSRGPYLEEDIALANIALDGLGQAQHLLRLAGQVEGKGRDEDALAYFRNEREFRNSVLVELPRGDFGFTIMKLFFFSAYSVFLFEHLQKSSHADFAGICAKALKECQYHLRHSSEWVIRLGDGTEESHSRAQQALNDLWPYCQDLHYQDSIDTLLAQKGIIPPDDDLKQRWDDLVAQVLTLATLTAPATSLLVGLNGRLGTHSEHLGHMLSEMQILARSHPGARW